MTQHDAACELTTAAHRLRPLGQTGEALAAIQFSPAAVECITELLDAASELARDYPDLARDHDRAVCDDYACDFMGRAISLARTVNGGEQR